MKIYRSHVLFYVDELSLKAGIKKIEMLLKAEIAKYNLENEINILETASISNFGKSITMVVYPEKITYSNITTKDIPIIVKEHFLKGRPVKHLIDKKDSVVSEYEFGYDKRIVLKNSGKIDPESIDEYLGVGGYEALEKVLTSMTPEQVVEEVKKSDLRGRGGAGFPTGLKWSFTAPLKAKQKYVVVNADEGEPGTFKDRLIMEGDPHKLLEGVMIASYAIGASQAFIYIRGEYKLCISRLQKAINQAKEYGLLGQNIFGTDFSLDIKIYIGAGAYVCGEETALIESMEGKRGNPRIKPPFPGVKGAWEKPTVVNNVETLSNVPDIILKGGGWFKNIGTEGSSGTKVFTVIGDVNTPGLCEVPMGTPLRTIIDKYGGGIKDGKKFKAALVGGAAGVFLPDNLLDVKMDYNNLKEYSAVLGSGAILVMNEDANMIDMLFSVLRFFRHESCGKCSPCKNGTEALYQYISNIRNGKGTPDDLDKMILLSKTMQAASFCPLGQSLIMPVQSAIENFREDFENYKKNKLGEQ